MHIHRLSYASDVTGWNIQDLSLDPLTLLVGASGVGKTRILQCILALKRIAHLLFSDTSRHGIQWSVDFSITSGERCQWQGKFGGVAQGHHITHERILVDHKVIIERNAEQIVFKGARTVKLSPTVSVISLLREEDPIGRIYDDFGKIIDGGDITSAWHKTRYATGIIDEKAAQYRSVAEIRACEEDIRLKLLCAAKNQLEVFKSIDQTFTSIFPFVQKILVQHGLIADHPERECILLSIQEHGMEHTIDESRISSGMLKSLLYIAELYLCADSSIFLMDEFENSLGVNCIDAIMENILTAERNLQFIITSHHPYIINNIDHRYWKIVKRKGNTVTVRNASDLGFDKSKHQAFTQLINLDDYLQGIEVGAEA